jgi:hypothetical protein
VGVCATLAARRPWPAQSTVASGLVCGLAGAALFIVIHSLLIYPIWTRFLGHLPFALAAGLALAGAFNQAAAHDRRLVRTEPNTTSSAFADGVRFGQITFASLAPATIFSNALRATGFDANDWPGFAGTVALAVASGAAAGWLLTRARAGALAFAASTLTLTIAMGGAIPVVNGRRAALLFAGFLPICLGAGTALSVARRCLTSPEPPTTEREAISRALEDIQ